ncbi:MAG: hypothetical protein HDS65_03935 [Bacteroidales bacterium]|nr:hypothetical protein [Bacteroidales bacterium]
MIIYFSGTGNTRVAAEKLGQLLGDADVRPFTASELRQPADAFIDCKPGDRVVWAFPTYSWGIPPVVAEVMKQCRFGAGAQSATHVMLTTCGDDMAYTDRQWRKIMHRRGLSTAGAYAVVMPNIYTLMKGFDVDSPALAAEKLAAAPDTLGQIVASIKSGGADMPVRLKFSGVKSHIVYPWFVRFAMSPKPFHSNEGCISCSLCARSCPMQNITMHEGRPQWGSQCALCLRCYHICPRHAVAYGKATDGKGQSIVEKL